jgi:energy-coupling factor transporter ATP-binding protein EcfA2
MTYEIEDWSFLGVDFSAAPGLGRIGDFFLPLRTGLTVLYGRNGTGKSLLLESLSAALKGSSPNRSNVHASLLIHLEHGHMPNNPNVEGLWVQPRSFQIYDKFLNHDRPSDWSDAAGWLTSAEELREVQKDIAWRLAEHYAIARKEDKPSNHLLFLASDVIVDGIYAIKHADGKAFVEPVLIDDGEKSTFNQFTQEESLKGIPNTNFMYSGWAYEVDSIQPQNLLQFSNMDVNTETLSCLRIMINILFGNRTKIAKKYDFTNDGLRECVSHVQPDTSFESQWISFASLCRRIRASSLLEFDDLGHIQEESLMFQILKLIEGQANFFFQKLLLDAPHIELKIPTMHELLVNNLRWGARHAAVDDWIPLDRLSTAEQKWAEFSIGMALYPNFRGFVILDEPERALHRSAEAYLAKGLQDLARDRDLCVVVASHSPEFLNLDDSAIFMLRHPDQRSEEDKYVQGISDVDRADLQGFGLLPSDLLRRQQGLLLVEGQHDLIVWQSLLGAELAERRIEVVPLRGAKQLKATLDSRVLFDFTDALIFPVLDALKVGFVQDTWALAVATKGTLGLPRAIDSILKAFKPIKADEARLMESFMTRALELDREARLYPQGLAAIDVLDYLPVSAFVASADSWKSLREELGKAKGGVPSGNEFKKWLQTAKNADLSDESIRQAAETCDYVPEDFTQVISRIDEVFEARR